MHDPELLILDEPINGLDPIGVAEVRAFTKRLSTEQGKTIIVSSHILSEVELLADDIGIIDHGHLLEEEGLAEHEEKNTRYLRLKVGAPLPAAARRHPVRGVQLSVLGGAVAGVGATGRFHGGDKARSGRQRAPRGRRARWS